MYVGARLEGETTIEGVTFISDLFLPLIIAYDSTLTLRWSDLLDGSDGSGEESIVSLTARAGALYSHFALSGALTEGSVNVPAGAMLLRHEVDGSGVRWGVPLDDTAAVTGGVTMDDAGNVLVHTGMNPSLPGPDFGGGTLTSHGSMDIVLASYEPGSGYRYARNMGGLDAEWAGDIAIHADGRILLVGNHHGSFSVDDLSHTASNPGGDVFLLEMAP